MHTISACTLVLAVSLAMPMPSRAQSSYKLVEWPMPATSAAGFAAPWNFIQVSGVAVSSKGTVLVLHRGAHAIRVDVDGNVWLIDATGHVIYKTNPDGKELMRLGTKGQSGGGPSRFNLPTDIAFASNGDLYV